MMRREDWNDTVLEHPDLELADKLVYHLLVRFGSDDLPVRRQIASLLRRSERHIRRVCARLRQHGFTVDDAPADTHVRSNGHPRPARTPMSDDADTHVRNRSYPHSARTPMSETDTHVRRNGHPCPARTPMSDPPTRTRTLWSSSSEEDSICTAVPPSSSSLLPSSSPPGEGRGEEGGLGGENRGEEAEETKSPPDPGGENTGEEEERTTSPSRGEENTGEETEGKSPPPDYLSEMQSWWATIAPEDPEDPQPWFTQLWTEFGAAIPLQVFREFVAAGRKRAELKYPDRYQRYFHTCCRNAQSPVSDTEADYANYEARMRAAYLADDAREEEAFENWEEKLRAGYLADDAREAAAFENGEAKLKAGYRADDAREAAAFENGEEKLKAGYLADDARTAADFQARLGSLLADHESAYAGDPDHVLAPFRAERRRS